MKKILLLLPIALLLLALKPSTPPQDGQTDITIEETFFNF